MSEGRSLPTGRRTGRLLRSVAVTASLLLASLGTSTAWADDEPAADAQAAPAAQDDDAGEDDENGEAGEENVENGDDENGDDEREAARARRLGDALGLSILGVASTTGGILFLSETASTRDQADEARRLGQTDRAENLDDRADRERILGITLTSLGVVLIGLATWFWIDYAQSADDGGDVAFGITPTVDPRGGAGLSIGGRF